MSNKLSLIVNFIGVDRMSSGLRNIVGLGQRGSQSLRGLNGHARRLQREMRDVGKEIRGSTGNVTALIERERELERALVGVNRQLDRQKRLSAIDADRRAMQQRGQDLRNRGAQNIAGGAALAAPFILAIKASADFSSGMVDIQQKAELTDQAADRLGSRIIRLSRSARQLPEDMRAGLDALLAKGLGVDPATQMLGPIGKLSTAYKVDIPDAANAGYASLNNLKIAASDTGRVFDIMAQAGNDGSFEIRDMARHFPSLTAQLQALGDKGVPAVADLSAALQVAMNTAGNADEAGNNIKNLLGKINAPGTIAAFRKNFGVDLPAEMKKMTDQGYSSMEAIALITQKATGGDLKRLGFGFEDAQARAGIMALIQNLDQYREIRERAGKAAGIVDRQFDQRVVRDATVQWRAFMGTASSLALTLGTTLLPVATQVLGYIDRGATAVGNWAQANPELAATLIKVAAGLITAKIGLGVLQFAFGTILGPVATAISLFRKAGVIARFGPMMLRLGSILSAVGPLAVRAFGMMRVAAMFLASGVLKAGLMMMANPIVLAIAAIVLAIGGAAYLIYTHWGSIRGAFDAGVGWVKNALAGLPDWLKSMGSMMMQGLLMALNPALLANRLLSIARSGVTAFKNFFGIKSPSRLFMEMGGHMTGGLALGIDRTARVPQRSVARMMNGMALDAPAFGQRPGIAARLQSAPQLRPAAQSGASKATPPTSIVLNVFGAAGQDIRELVKAVMRELEKVFGIRARRSYEGDR
ncbi:MAG: phage tail tape measure protein [Alphaproteobacteria bacterium HGW-Alphaproteobacteria-16]|nr:MAG: phage tail tape measure protein [Alphaproteobacteria bacterium HGW-Alphaproteobacteria-16]